MGAAAFPTVWPVPPWTQSPWRPKQARMRQGICSQWWSPFPLSLCPRASEYTPKLYFINNLSSPAAPSNGKDGANAVHLRPAETAGINPAARRNGLQRPAFAVLGLDVVIGFGAVGRFHVLAVPVELL